MIVYRIANEEFKTDISGEGSAIYGGRWNSIGMKLLYTSEFISLTILESLVHFRSDLIPPSQFILYIDIPEKDIIEISTDKLNSGWVTEPDYTQWIGDQFINSNQAMILKVPSVIVPRESNLLINPLHKDFKKVKLISTELLQLDKRLHIS